MATVRATCPTCGDVQLTIDEVRVRVCLDDDRGEYSFRCPLCGLISVQAAEHRTVDLLVASGAHLDTWSLPAELLERPSEATAIGHDDVLSFHELLHDDEALDHAVRALLG